MYESVTEAFAATYHDDTKFFGPVPLTPYPFPGRSKESLDENQNKKEKYGKYNRKIRRKKLKKNIQELTKK